MNMKKITGMLVGATAMVVCGSANAAGPVAITNVPFSVTLRGELASIQCTFTANQLRANVGGGEKLGELMCTNPNSSSVYFAPVVNSGTSNHVAVITLSNGAAAITAQLYKEHGGVWPPFDADADSVMLSGLDPVAAGVVTRLPLLSSRPFDGLPGGSYVGSIDIATWAV